MGVNIFHKLMLIAHVKPVVIWVFRRIKIPIIILYELIDSIQVIRIKMFALYAEVPFDRFGKELCFAGVCLGDFVVVAQCWIIALTLWLEKVTLLKSMEQILKKSVDCKILLRAFIGVGTVALIFRKKQHSTSCSSNNCYGKPFCNDFFSNHITIALVHNHLRNYSAVWSLKLLWTE